MVYFELIEYLVQSFEVKLEFSHMIMVSKFLQSVGASLDKNLTYMHTIFENDQDEVPIGRKLPSGNLKKSLRKQ